MHGNRINNSLKVRDTKPETTGKNKGIAPICFFGQVTGYNVMVMGLLGPSLEDLFQYCGKRFSLKTTIMLACEFFN